MLEIDREKCDKLRNPKECYRCLSIIEQLFSCDELLEKDRKKLEEMLAFIKEGRDITRGMARKLEKLRNFYL